MALFFVALLGVLSFLSVCYLVIPRPTTVCSANAVALFKRSFKITFFFLTAVAAIFITFHEVFADEYIDEDGVVWKEAHSGPEWWEEPEGNGPQKPQEGSGAGQGGGTLQDGISSILERQKAERATLGESGPPPGGQNLNDITIGASSLEENVAQIRKDADILLYALLPLFVAVILLWRFCLWFYRAFIQSAFRNNI